MKSLKTKILVSLLAVGIIPFSLLGFFIYRNFSDSLMDSHYEKLKFINDLKKKEVTEFFKKLSDETFLNTENPTTAEAIKNLSESFYKFGSETGWSQELNSEYEKELKKYYTNDFNTEFKKQNENEESKSDEVFNQLKRENLVLQYSYIAKNKNPLGSKHLLSHDDLPTTYNKFHQKYHPWFREQLERIGLYDIFLVDLQGSVVYTVFKELDFATNLKTGPYAKSSLAKLYEEILKQDPSKPKTLFADYENYYASYNGAASFMGAPIVENGKIIGVFAVQISFDKINELTGFIPKGITDIETLMVGTDFKLRSDTLFNKDTFNVKNSFRYPEKYSIKSKEIDQAITGNSLNGRRINLRGHDVIYAIDSLDIFGNKWSIETNHKAEAALASLVHVQKIIYLFAAVIFSVILFLALFVSNRFSNLLRSIATRLKNEITSLTINAKKLSESSSSLSAATTEQSSSLQETVASIDEISAMVARNSDSANQATEVSEKSTKAAQKGKEKTEELMSSINQIKSGNDEMMKKMQRSNDEISEIVKVIQDISQKTKVINDIVFQTKLLSFNASVEAARAGEHGKGFAVVAEEVGNLASMSGKAANEISEMLERSVKKVSSVVDGSKLLMDDMMKDIKSKVDVGTKNASECSVALEEILSNVSVANEMVREIATASIEQTTGVKEINKAMSELDKVTQSNNSVSQEVSLSANDLSGQSSRIEKITNELSFFVDGNIEVREFKNHDSHSEKSNRKNSTSSHGKSEMGKVLTLTPKQGTKKSLNPAPNHASGAKVSSEKDSINYAVVENSTPEHNDPRFEEV
ncbi:MAG: methyl-accepting chemotaxis protein [Bacteriovoracaceae bacterium]|nr:methyl-accepting chemotaxis protein [Bacteriovoracaceae bacterium]